MTPAEKKARKHAWYMKNRERLIAKQLLVEKHRILTPEQKLKKNAAARRRRKANPAKAKLLKAQEYSRHKESYKAKNRANYAENKDTILKRAKFYRTKNKDIIKQRIREYTYGLTHAQYLLLWDRQSGNCAICQRTLVEENRQTHVDHCHTAGVVRGLLCVDCNVGLGRLKDNCAVAYNAFKYLLGFALAMPD